MNAPTRVYYEWSRLAAIESWWHAVAIFAIVLAVVAYVVWLYRRDAAELPRPVRWSLLLLRLAAFGGLLLYFFDLQKRSEQPLVRASQVAVLVDGSLSMTLPAGDAAEQASVGSSTAELARIATEPGSAPETRIEQTVRSLGSGPLLTELTQDHEVTVYRFEGQGRPAALASFPKEGPIEGLGAGPASSADASLATVRTVAWIGTACLIVAAIVLAVCLTLRLRSGYTAGRRVAPRAVRGRSEDRPVDAISYGILASVVLAIAGAVCVATAAVRGSEYQLASLWSFGEAQRRQTETDEAVLAGEADGDPRDGDPRDAAQPVPPEDVDWARLLPAQGGQSRIGEAVAAVLGREQNSPLAGVVLISDGQSNAGLSLESAASQAAASGVPLYAIGLGSARDPVNVRLVDVQTPKRVFPGDRFRVSGTVQAVGLPGRSITVQLRRRGAADGGEPAGDASFAILEEQTIEVPEGGQLAAVNFEVDPPAIGRYSYDVRVLAPPGDANAEDDSAVSDVEVIAPQARVLIIAGGPTREYQFVRNLLFRDATIQTDVFLQTGGPGMSQEADQLLTEFPTTQQTMSQYECVLAFDADWLSLPQEAVTTLEQWVSSGAGGLVMIAGPIATAKWTGSAGNADPRARLLRDMAPVVLNSRGSRLVSLGRFEGETVWPLKLTNESAGVDFLDVANSAQLSADAWSSFDGVYSFYSAYELKPGATPLAYFSDPTTLLDGSLPVYLASQFYGGGRVVFQGSGEMWRIRDVDENYFNTYWTKLVRWAAQGRLLRDSDYGLLLTDKEEGLLGDQVTLRAVLKDSQFQPLRAASVTANVLEPNGRLTPIELRSLPGSGQEGVYVGQLLLRQTGKYNIRLDTRTAGGDVLSRQVVARVPTAEIERPKRNDAGLLLSSLRSGGVYFAGFANALAGRPFPAAGTDAATGGGDVRSSGGGEGAELTRTAAAAAEAPQSLPELLVPRDQINFLPGAPDREFQQRWLAALMGLIAGCLSLEWLLRRLCRLA